MASVDEYAFDLDVAGERVPGLAWLPAAPRSQRTGVPIVIHAHGLTHDKRSPLHVPLARALARDEGIVSVALDAPAHGEREDATGLSPEECWIAYRTRWRERIGRDMADAIDAAIGHVRERCRLEPGPIAFWGLSLGTQYGLAWLASRHATARSVCGAVLGLFGSGPIVDRYAPKVDCPVYFIRQLDDAVHPAEGVARLFERFPNPESRLVSSPGAHEAVPVEVALEAKRFLLARVATARL